MTPAEYQTIREACGLSQQAAASFHNVALRTVQHWEQGRNAVPAGVAEEIRRLDARIERAVLEAVDLATEQKPDAVDLIRYRTDESYAGSRADREGLPHGCHNALIGRTRVALERLGMPVRIAWG